MYLFKNERSESEIGSEHWNKTSENPMYLPFSNSQQLHI